MTSNDKFSKRFKKSYENIKNLHLSKSISSSELVNKFSNEIDKLISSEIDINYRSSGIAILALGGYGRKELCIKSDIDILILYETPKFEQAKLQAENILYKLWDTGLEVGNSLRSIDECLELASMQDSTILSSMMDLRAITGDSNLCIKLKNSINKKLLPNISQNYINEKLLERKKRYRKFSTPTYLIEPDVKEGKGCLRDIHSLFWILRANICDIDLDKSISNEFITKEDLILINEAQEFFLQLRNHLHVIKSSYIDVFDYDSQKEVAKFFDIKNEKFLTKENILMKIFNEYRNQIYDITDKIISRITDKDIFQSKRIQNLNDFYIIHRGLLKAINPSLIAKDPENILKAFELSSNNNIEIADDVMNECKKLTKTKITKNDKILFLFSFAETIKRCKSVSNFIEKLNKANILSFFIPEFDKIRNLSLADPSHIYTVDVHSIFLIKEFEKLINNEYIDEFPFETKIAKKIKKKDLFSVAALLHDIGKGFGKGHSDRGAVMSETICERFSYNEDSKELIYFLIKEHLTMSGFSQKRDMDDMELIDEFRKRIKTIEKLDYLFILTFCDLRSVASDVWSDWKGNLLRLLYKKTFSMMTKKTQKKSSKNLKNIKLSYTSVEIENMVGKAHKQYFEVYSSDEVEYQLKILEKSSDDLVMGIRYSQKRKIDYLTFWSRTKRIGFIDICKELSSESINIFSARLAELKSNLHVYTLEVNRFGNSTFNDRKIWNTIKKNIKAKNKGVAGDEKNHLLNSNYKTTLKAKVKIDNDLSSKFSIIELTAGDKPGMLYSILRTIKNLGLRIRFVKISTKRESVEDVFYVTKGSKGKIYNINEIENIRKNIMDVIK